MTDCNNYWGISLLGDVGKFFARVVLMQLQVLLVISTQNPNVDPGLNDPELT